MTTELYWLALTVLMTGLFWLPYIFDRIAVRGAVPTMAGSGPGQTDDQSPWARRALSAHRNAIENLVIFATAVLMLHVLELSTPTTQLAAVGYFFARITHFVVYTLGIPVVRTLAFAAGWLAQIVILATILGWL